MNYFGASKQAQFEKVVKKSRFIGLVCPVDGADDAVRWINGVRTAHPDATHVCFAFRTDSSGSESRFSDDGEPKGTAGLPILEVLKKSGATHTAVSVVRYFGGIKLGAGGLSRAYTDVAARALDEAELTEFYTAQRFMLVVDYDKAALIKSEEEQSRCFGDRVEIIFATEDAVTLQSRLAEALSFTPELIRLNDEILPRQTRG